MGVAAAGPMAGALRHLTPALISDEPLYVFGYGSLVWRPALLSGPEPTRTVCLRGWKRVFWQGSTDHRGTPQLPGRVVTLHPTSPSAVTWGVALRLPPPGRDRVAVLEYLEEREKQYDVRLRADLYADDEPDSAAVIHQALVYVGSEDRTLNVNYLGDAPLEELAATVAAAEGPSGTNREYVFQLADALHALGKRDEHVAELAAAVRGLVMAEVGPRAQLPPAG